MSSYDPSQYTPDFDHRTDFQKSMDKGGAMDPQAMLDTLNKSTPAVEGATETPKGSDHEEMLKKAAEVLGG